MVKKNKKAKNANSKKILPSFCYFSKQKQSLLKKNTQSRWKEYLTFKHSCKNRIKIYIILTHINTCVHCHNNVMNKFLFQIIWFYSNTMITVKKFAWKYTFVPISPQISVWQNSNYMQNLPIYLANECIKTIGLHDASSKRKSTKWVK